MDMNGENLVTDTIKMSHPEVHGGDCKNIETSTKLDKLTSDEQRVVQLDNNNQCSATESVVIETDPEAGNGVSAEAEGGVTDPALEGGDDDMITVEDESPALDIYISNVVSTFNSKCHLNLRRIAQEGSNVEFRRESGRVTMKLRNPTTTANMWSSGKITLTGATSEENARIAARKFARFLQRIGFKVKFTSFRVVNVLGTCSLPFGVRLAQFTMGNRKYARYEPELHPAVTYEMKKLKAVLKVFSTGSVTVTAPSVIAVQTAIEAIYPVVFDHQMPKPKPRNKTPKEEHRTVSVSSDDDDDVETL